MEKLLAQLRVVDTRILTLIAPLVWHIRWTDEQIKSLEEDLRKIRQNNMLDSKEFQEKRDAEIIKGIERRRPLGVKEPLSERLLFMVLHDKVGSEEWDRTLRWNGLTFERAMSLVNEERERVKNDQMQSRI